MVDASTEVLDLLIRIDGKVDRMGESLNALKVGMIRVEEGFALVNERLDRFDTRLARIEHRLDAILPR